MKRTTGITQKQLLTRMRRLGFKDMTARRIVDWRTKELLPPFDGRGGGIGRGKGRAASSWRNGRLITERAVWVYRLLDIYKYANQVYLPLWMLGFKVPPGQVRPALGEPLEDLEKFRQDGVERLMKVQSYDRRDGIVEDFVGDFAVTQLKDEEFARVLRVPQETLEAAINLFINPDFRIDDFGFQEGSTQLVAWKKELNNEIVPALLHGLGDGRPIDNEPRRPEGIEIVFEQPTFFQQYLSVPCLQRAVSIATPKEFTDVQQICSSLGS